MVVKGLSLLFLSILLQDPIVHKKKPEIYKYMKLNKFYLLDNFVFLLGPSKKLPQK